MRIFLMKTSLISSAVVGWIDIRPVESTGAAWLGGAPDSLTEDLRRLADHEASSTVASAPDAAEPSPTIAAGSRDVGKNPRVKPRFLSPGVTPASIQPDCSTPNPSRSSHQRFAHLAALAAELELRIAEVRRRLEND
jgi:hypothetical protein